MFSIKGSAAIAIGVMTAVVSDKLMGKNDFSNALHIINSPNDR